MPLDDVVLAEPPALVGDRLEDVLRELRYCVVEPGSRFREGQVARAQDAALARGWLGPAADRPGFLVVTEAGRGFLALHPAAL